MSACGALGRAALAELRAAVSTEVSNSASEPSRKLRDACAEPRPLTKPPESSIGNRTRCARSEGVFEITDAPEPPHARFASGSSRYCRYEPKFFIFYFAPLLFCW